MDASISLAAALALAVAAGAADGQRFEDLEAIDVRAAELAATMGKQAIAIDRRIRLPMCPELAAIEPVDANSLAVRCVAIGWRLRISLRPIAGPIPAAAPAAVPMVRRGDNLRLRVQRASFVLIYNVVAGANGSTGDVIPVRADGSKTVLQAELVAPGQAILRD